MYLDRLFKMMADRQASDLFISCGAPINMKVNGVVAPLSERPMDLDTVRRVAYELMSDEQAKTFEAEHEMNLSHLDPHIGNFRINIFRQRGTISLVIRYVRSDIPPFEQLRLPPVLLDLVMEKRGLIMIAGATGSGKSTTLAAMIDYRNTHRTGHILTVEDPIEYLFRHKKSVVNQRELTVDTKDYTRALANALREAPDLIMIGEVRDRETMQQALLHTLTGHLCLTTIHANNSYHALSRIINMFPYDARSGLLSDLSIGLRAIVSQRLVRNKEGALQPAVEILLNTSLIAELVKNGEITQIKEAMEKSLYPGSQTFEQALCRLYVDGSISYEEAMTASDSSTNLAWLINQNAPTARVDGMALVDPEQEKKPRRTHSDFTALQIEPDMLDRPH
jgi:twitching motility protein PilU